MASMNLQITAQNVRSGSQFRHHCNNNIFHISDRIETERRQLTILKRQVIQRADAELADPGITPNTVSTINNIKSSAQEHFIEGHDLLLEAMQAVQDILCANT